MNREIVPGGLYPLSGDVTSQAGNNTVTVVGLQTVPVSSIFPVNGSILVYDSSINQWVPTGTGGSGGNGSVKVNSLTVSDDYFVSINVSRPIKVNGV